MIHQDSMENTLDIKIYEPHSISAVDGNWTRFLLNAHEKQNAKQKNVYEKKIFYVKYTIRMLYSISNT